MRKLFKLGALIQIRDTGISQLDGCTGFVIGITPQGEGTGYIISFPKILPHGYPTIVIPEYNVDLLSSLRISEKNELN